MTTTRRMGVLAGVALIALGIGWARCSKKTGDAGESALAGSADRPLDRERPPTTKAASSTSGLGLPIAAQHVASGVLVAALDAGAGGIRVQRIDAKDQIVADRIVLAEVSASNESDLKLTASPDGESIAVVWRGLRAGKLVRQLVLLGADLAAKGEPVEIAGASCATRDGLWSSDGVHALHRPWASRSGSATRLTLPKDKDVSLLCGPRRAFAVMEEEDRTALLSLGPDGGAPITIVRESDFGEDEQRELSQYTVGDDVGVVRLGASGALAFREVAGGALGPLRKLKTKIGKDDDVVAVDASPRVLVIVHTGDTGGAPTGGAPTGGNEGDGDASAETTVQTCTKVSAVRVDRQTLEESTVELAPARCGFELGPYFTSALGDGVAVAWPERTGGVGHARAPIVGLAHAVLGVGGGGGGAGAGAAGTATPLTRSAQIADAIVDAGCDAAGCYAVALARREAEGPGVATVLRYR